MTSNTSMKKKKSGLVPKSVSDSEALDNAVGANAAWLPSSKQEDLVHTKNNQNEVLRKTLNHSELQIRQEKIWLKNVTEADKDQPIRRDCYDRQTLNQKQQEANNRQGYLTLSVNSGMEEIRRTKRRSQRVRKKGAPNGTEGSRHKRPTANAGNLEAGTPPTVTSMVQDSSTRTHTMGPRGGHGQVRGQRWSNPAEDWGSSYHTCHRSLTESLTEYHVHSRDFTLPRDRPVPPAVHRSITDTDIRQKPNLRSTSFGRFDALRHPQSPSKPEENSAAEDGSAAPDGCNQGRHGGLGKKMKSMYRIMGRKHVKSFSEETADENDRTRNAETESTEKHSVNASNSLESLCSGQSSTSGVTSSSDGSGTRDSLRLEEETPSSRLFCGRARVHTDFVPSPYDTDSLKLKVGDIINIISKPPMGIWTGLLNNKVGSFKFIYADVLPEKEEKEEEEEPAKKRPQRICRKPQPRSLLELLEQLQLEDYASSLLINGYQTVEDLRHLKERHLTELNIVNPEHRYRLLAAAQFHYQAGGDDVGECKGNKEDEEKDCPRDSGCFIPSECPDNKEDVESQAADTPVY
ncbi:SAM domain-containing protein SAMSN-1a isoform X2 [Denticeps clupeoides]|nr:SAM domain-containing protein SAMSN-1-like isoform X2 [Denticeps clupeoides]